MLRHVACDVDGAAPVVGAAVVAGVLSPSAQNPAAVGLRIDGAYAGPGASIEFHLDTAILTCDDAAVERAYAVQKTDREVLVTLKDAVQPIVLALRQDGSLAGNETVEVKGRVISGAGSGNAVAYAAKSGKFSLAVLAPARI